MEVIPVVTLNPLVQLQTKLLMGSNILCVKAIDYMITMDYH